jgi:hypothetical protein
VVSRLAGPNLDGVLRRHYYGEDDPDPTHFAFPDPADTGTSTLIDSWLDSATRGTAVPTRALDKDTDILHLGGISGSFNGATTKIRLHAAVVLLSSLNRKRREVAFIPVSIIQRY